MDETNQNFKEKQFDSLQSEIAYYKTKYIKYKQKSKTLNENLINLRKDNSSLQQQYNSCLDELKVEKDLRKKYEQRIIGHIKNEKMNENSNRRQFKEDAKNFVSNNEKILVDSLSIHSLRSSTNNGFDEFETKDINLETNNEQYDFTLSSTLLKEKSLRELSEKFDTETLKNSLTVDFLEFDKDNLRIRKIISNKEEKLQKLEKIMKYWIELGEQLRKSTETIIQTFSQFNDNFIVDIEIFEECPDLISLLYCLQGVLHDINNLYKTFSFSIDNAFITPLKHYINITCTELRETKINFFKHQEEFNLLSSKFLNTKKNYLKESMKDSYNSTYKMYEFSRFDYINKINQSLLFTKVELPEKAALLIYAFISLFKQGFETVHKIEYNVNVNLEKVAIKFKEKEKINDEIKTKKKNLIKILETARNNLTNKEGFLHVKIKDSNAYFKRRYFIIKQGNLIYFKLKKGTDIVDSTKSFQLCNLLLSNVKRNDKDYDYPFCFEIISASDKKCYLLQGETQKDTDEWLFALNNAIANSISQYNNKTTEPVNTNATPPREGLSHSDSFSDVDVSKRSKVEILLEKIVNNHKCADCGNSNPNWCSINWLLLLCLECCGVHRSLGVQYSKVRSLRLDNVDIELIDILESLGQDQINKIVEANVRSFDKPNYNSTIEEKEIFILNKYKERKYMKTPIMSLKENETEEQFYIKSIFKFIETADLLNIYYLLKISQIDLNKLYQYNGETYAFAHHAAKLGHFDAFKLLVCLGSDIQLPDAKNLKPIDYATIYKNGIIVDFILKKIEEYK